MNGSVLDKIHEYLLAHGPADPQKVADAIPELTNCGGAERARLLMRLDPELTLLQSGSYAVSAESWILREFKLKQAAHEHFLALNTAGAPLSSFAAALVAKTGIDSETVKALLSKFYVVHGTNVFNRKRK